MTEDYGELRKEKIIEELEYTKKRIDLWENNESEYIKSKFIDKYKEEFEQFKTELYFIELERNYLNASYQLELDGKLKHYFITLKKSKEGKQ